MNKFAQWMKLEGASDGEVAGRVGVTKMYIYKLRNDFLLPTPSFAWKFAKAYGFGLARELFDVEREAA